MQMSERRRRGGRLLDGVLLLDKPPGISSNAALQQARRLLGAAKAGHTGTLDPLASGLLPLLFGEATKFAQTLLAADKRYLASVRFGSETTTADAEGEVVATAPVTFSIADLMGVLERFRGEIEQTPPMFSALKREGRPLYELARQGIEVERAPRRIFIHALRLVSWHDDVAVLDVQCSKGAYIRTLASDLGRALGCGAHLAALRRTAVGAWKVEQALTLAEFAELDEAQRLQRLLPIDALVGDLPAVTLSAAAARRLQQGQTMAWPNLPRGLVRLYGPQGFFGLGMAKEGNQLVPHRLMRHESGRGAA